MDHDGSWAPIGPPWLERLGYIIERKDAKPMRTGMRGTVLAVTGALFLAALMSAITHALLTGAALVALVALLTFAGRRWVLPARRHLTPAPDPKVTGRTRTTVTSVTVKRIGQPVVSEDAQVR